MSNSKRISPTAIHALKEALASIFWYKSDLKSFLRAAIRDRTIVENVPDWNCPKRQIVADIVDFLCSRQEKHLDELRALFHGVSEMKSFPHLERLEDGADKVKRAQVAVTNLSQLVSQHDTAQKLAEDSKARQEREARRLREMGAVKAKLSEMHTQFIDIVSRLPAQERGYALENLLYQVFELFDLDPKASFKTLGEQIDGGFTFDGTDWILEAKWQAKAVQSGDLDKFAGKIRRKLENTLGLFLSVNGYTENAVKLHSQTRPVFILMTGADLMAVLEERIDLLTLLRRKRQHAGRTGEVLLDFSRM